MAIEIKEGKKYNTKSDVYTEDGWGKFAHF
jgi:hypothetical protein